MNLSRFASLVASLSLLAVAAGCSAPPDAPTSTTEEAYVVRGFDAGKDSSVTVSGPLVCRSGVPVVPQIDGYGCGTGVYESSDQGRDYKIIYACAAVPPITRVGGPWSASTTYSDACVAAPDAGTLVIFTYTEDNPMGCGGPCPVKEL